MATINALMLKNVQSNNSFQYQSNFTIRQGNTYNGLTIQLVDTDQSLGYFTTDYNQIKNNIYLRYMPPAANNPVLSLTFNDLNSNNIVTTTCSQIYTDTSLWSFNLTAAQTSVMAGGNIVANYYENNVLMGFVMINAMNVLVNNPGQCL